MSTEAGKPIDVETYEKERSKSATDTKGATNGRRNGSPLPKNVRNRDDQVANLKNIIASHEARIEDLKKELRSKNRIIYRLNNGLLNLRPKQQSSNESK